MKTGKFVGVGAISVGYDQRGLLLLLLETPEEGAELLRLVVRWAGCSAPLADCFHVSERQEVLCAVTWNWTWLLLQGFGAKR